MGSFRLADPLPAPEGVGTDGRCFHCGGPCGGETLQDAEKLFCCNGCYTVFSLLSQHSLDGYYKLERHPGQRPVEAGRWSWLDDPAAAAKLLDFESPNLNKAHFRLPGMHCAACIYLLEQLYKIQPGITGSEVDFPRREISLSYNPALINLRQVVELLEVLGYTPALSMADVEAPRQVKPDRTLWYELGIAAFCFGNIMMTSFPEYLGIEEGAYSTMFRWVNMGLSLPVVLISARSYYRSAWQGLKHKMINMDVPIVLGIIVLFLRSSFEVISGTGAGYFDSLAGLLFFLLLGKAYQRKTFHLLAFDRDFKSYFPISVSRLKPDEEEEMVPVRNLKVGDRILVRHGELIPADARLLKGKAKIDYSFVTGEAELIPVALGEKLFAGGRQNGEPLEMVLDKEVSQGYLTRLWNHEAFRKSKSAEVTQLSDSIGQRFTPVVLLIALVAGIFWAVVDPGQIWNVVTAVLIVACPCALALSTPFTLGHTLRIFGRRGFYLKGMAVVERMAQADALIFDKTGTLTSTKESEVQYAGREMTSWEQDAVRALLRASVHPLSRRLYAWLQSGNKLDVEEFEEIEGQGLRGVVGGKEIVLGARTFVQAEGSGAEGSVVYLRIAQEQLGRFEVMNALRPGAKELMADIGKDYQIGMLSGDHPGSRATMEALLPAGAELRFRQAPEDKLSFIREWQQAGKKVAMVGDGLNDAGALQQSDLGIAITDDLTAFTPASDAILHGASLSELPDFLRLSKASIRMVKASFGVSFLYNVVGVSFAVSANLSPLVAAILMPLSSLSVILFTTTGVSLVARKLLKERAAQEEERRRPSGEMEKKAA